VGSFASTLAFSPAASLTRRGTVAVFALLTAPHLAWSQPAGGPKKRLAVLTVSIGVKNDTLLGGPDAGDVLADQLSAVLAESGQFDVMDRADVGAIRREQSLKPDPDENTRAVTDPTPLVAAQILVRASLSTLDTVKGSGTSFSIGGADLAGTLGRKHEDVLVGFDIRLVDTATGRVVGAFHIQEKAASGGVSVGLQRTDGTAVNHDLSHNTPLGQATQRAFEKALPQIAARLRDVAWTGRVADVAGSDVFLNVGAQAGVRVGASFAVTRVERRIVDPSTGEVLGVSEQPVGQVTVIEVQDRFSRARGTSPAVFRKGDLVRFASA
jgi:curli biogenesis system outer membrane secretion channel CsgG